MDEAQLLESVNGAFDKSTHIDVRYALSAKNAHHQALLEKYYLLLRGNKKHSNKLKAQLSILLANFIKLESDRPGEWIHTPKGKSNIDGNRYFKGLSHSVFIQRILDNPKAHSLINQKLGFKGNYKNFQTQIQPAGELRRDIENTPKGPDVQICLDNFEPIVVQQVSNKGRKKQRKKVKYTDTAYTNKIRKEMNFINEHLELTDINLWVDDNELIDLKKRYRAKNQKGELNIEAKALKRIFNDEKFKTGGRLYGGFWQSIPSEYRQCITINHQFCGEVDFQTLHPNMLYAREGLVSPDNIYSLNHNPSTPTQRKVLKQLFQILLNSKSKAGAERAVVENNLNYEQFKMSPSELIQNFTNKHEKISHRFYKSFGLLLQLNDSDIACDIIMKMLNIHGVMVLPVHDSFIVPIDLVSELKLIMIGAYKDYCGKTINITESDINERLPSMLGGDDYNLKNYNAYFDRMGLKDETFRTPPYINAPSSFYDDESFGIEF